MILVDANLLIYAHVERMPAHATAKARLDSVIAGTERVGMPWANLLAFMRVVTNPRVFTNPHAPESAWEIIEGWLAQTTVWTPGPTERHREVFAMLVAEMQPKGDDVPDAHLAALAIEHNLTLATADRGFARFPGLQWMNPLAQDS